jgi:hypothetical protein
VPPRNRAAARGLPLRRRINQTLCENVLLPIKRRSLSLNRRYALVYRSDALLCQFVRRSAVLTVNGNNFVAVYYDFWFGLFILIIHEFFFLVLL